MLVYIQGKCPCYVNDLRSCILFPMCFINIVDLYNDKTEIIWGLQYMFYSIPRKIKKVMVNNSTNINKTDNNFSPQLNEHKNTQDIWSWKSMSWHGKGTYIRRGYTGYLDTFICNSIEENIYCFVNYQKSTIIYVRIAFVLKIIEIYDIFLLLLINVYFCEFSFQIKPDASQLNSCFW